MHCGKQNQDYPRLLQHMPTLFHSPQALGQPPVKLETVPSLLLKLRKNMPTAGIKWNTGYPA